MENGIDRGGGNKNRGQGFHKAIFSPGKPRAQEKTAGACGRKPHPLLRALFVSWRPYRKWAKVPQEELTHSRSSRNKEREAECALRRGQDDEEVSASLRCICVVLLLAGHSLLVLLRAPRAAGAPGLTLARASAGSRAA